MTGRSVVLGVGGVLVLAVAVASRAWVAKCPAEEEWAVPGGVAAAVSGQDILWEDVDLDVLAAMAQAGVRYEGAAGQRQVRELRQGMRERAVERVLLEQEARRRGYKTDSGQVKKALEGLRSQVPEGTLLDRLVKRGLFEGALQRRAASAVLLEQLMADLRRQSVLSEEEAQAYYRENLDRFREPEAAYFRQVVTLDRGSAAEVARRLRVGDQIEAVGERFAADRSGFEKGAGELRMFRGNPDPREPVLFRLKVGEVSDPVELPQGFAVLRLERRTPPKQLAFVEVRERIEKTLADRKFNDALRQLVRGLRDRTQIARSPLPGAETPAPSPSPAENR